MLPPPCLTVGKAQFSWFSSPGRRHTCWTPSESNKFTLDYQTTGHGSSNSCSWPGCLQQTVCRLFCKPASEEASFWNDGHANRLVAVCGVWSEHWQADLSLLQPLKQCWQHSCVFWSQLLHLTHNTRTQLLWSTLARPVSSETRLWKPLYDPGHCTVRVLPNFL